MNEKVYLQMEGFQLEVEPETWRVANVVVNPADQNGSDLIPVMFEQASAGLLYAPPIETVGVQHQTVPVASLNIQFQEEVGEEVVVFQAIPITPGQHREFIFTEAVLEEAVPLMNEGMNVVVHHTFNEPRDVVGRILKAEKTTDGLLVTGVVWEPSAMERVQSGHFHSVSLHSLVRVHPEDRGLPAKRVVRLEVMREMTLTDIPQDKKAIIVNHHAATMAVALESISSNNSQHGENMQRAEKDANVESVQLGPDEIAVAANEEQLAVELEANTPCTDCPPAAATQPMNETPPPAESEANPKGEVKMEQTPEDQNAPASVVQLEDRVKQLEVALETERQERQLLEDQARLKDVKLEVTGMIDAGQLPPAAKEPAQLLLISLNEEQKKQWNALAMHLKVAPLGGAQATNAGLVPKNQQGDTVPAAFNLTGASNEDLEMLAFAELNRVYEAKGGHGIEAARKHHTNAKMGVFPSIYDNQETN